MPNMKQFLTNQLLNNINEIDTFVKLVQKQEKKILELNQVDYTDYKTSLVYKLKYDQMPVEPYFTYNNDKIKNIINNIDHLDFKRYNSQLTKSNVLSLLPAYKDKILSFQSYDINLNQKIIKLIITNLENNDNIAKQFLYIKLINFIFNDLKDEFILNKIKKRYISQDYCGFQWFFKNIDCPEFKNTFDIDLFGLTLVQLHKEEFNTLEAFVDGRFNLSSTVKETLIRLFVNFFKYDENTIKAMIDRIDSFCFQDSKKPKTPMPITLDNAIKVIENTPKKYEVKKNRSLNNTFLELIKEAELENHNNNSELHDFDPIEYFKDKIKEKTKLGEDESKILTVELFRDSILSLKNKDKIINCINKDIDLIISLLGTENINIDLYQIKQLKWKMNLVNKDDK